MSYSVLVVDDSATIRSIVKRSIEMSGLDLDSVYQAENGLQALEVLGERRVDLVLADLNMPTMGGLELIQKMSERDLFSSIPVVIVSSERSQTRIDELESLGIKAYLTKPIRPESLHRVVLGILSTEESAGANGRATGEDSGRGARGSRLQLQRADRAIR
ncbi:MAG: response regulator [Myxococcota bacterium]